VSFAAPGYLLALLLVPVAVAGYREARRRRRRYPVRFPAFETLAAVAPRGPDWRGHVPAALFVLALTGLVLAMAKPEKTVAVPVERASVVLVTDVSRSMQATDVSPSRLEAARGAADSFLGRVPDALRVGLVAFSDTAQTLQTPTTAHDDVRAALATLDTVAGTSTGAGLNTALADLQIGTAGGTRRPPSAIVLLSDGSATDGDAAFSAARDARRLRIPIYTVALGTPDGEVVLPDGRRLSVPPDPAALQRIAAASGGEAFQAQDSDQLDAVYDRLGSQIGTRREQREITSTFAGLALLLLAGAVVGTLRWSGRLP
jgi:Ca-activated chloride channel family protein